jgi:hypothetical protein
VPLPPEPGRLAVCALLGRARRARGCTTPGDDRIETRVYAVKRYLFRLGHAARSGRFATSVEQLVVGLAPVMGWGAVPRGGSERARFVRAHRKSVQRWLDDLQATGIVAHVPERDMRGQWWRTQIILLAASDPTTQELRVARVRARGWQRRERSRRRTGRVAPSLAAIRGRSGVPGRVSRSRVARARARVAHEARRRTAVDAQIALAGELRAGCGLLTHPYGAPPTSAETSGSPRPSRRSATPDGAAPLAWSSAQALMKNGALIERTGADAAGARATVAARPALKERSEETGRVPPGDFDALVLRRVAARERKAAWRASAIRAQASQRAADVTAWPAGRACPLGRLREAWVVHRYGLARVAESGAATAGPTRPPVGQLARRAIALYEAHAEQRPPGWPTNGPAALCALATQRRADWLAGDVARLLTLASAMRATALEHDADRLARARSRAASRRTPPEGRIAFRTLRPRLETAEQRRQRVRDAVLLTGGNPAAWPNAELALDHIPTLRAARVSDPQLVDRDSCAELDGVGARAARYRAQLTHGHWQLPPDWTTTPTPPPARRRPAPHDPSQDHTPARRAAPESDRIRHTPSGGAARDRAIAPWCSAPTARCSSECTCSPDQQRTCARHQLHWCASAHLRMCVSAPLRVRSDAHRII